jgi:hypothetical protein
VVLCACCEGRCLTGVRTHEHIKIFLRMTVIMTSQIIDISSWDTLYIGEKLRRKIKGILCPIYVSRKSYFSRGSKMIRNNCARNVTRCLYLITHSLLHSIHEESVAYSASDSKDTVEGLREGNRRQRQTGPVPPSSAED